MYALFKSHYYETIKYADLLFKDTRQAEFEISITK